MVYTDHLNNSDVATIQKYIWYLKIYTMFKTIYICVHEKFATDDNSRIHDWVECFSRFIKNVHCNVMNKLYNHIFQRVRNTFHTTNGMNRSNLKHCEDITREILKSKSKL